MRFDFATAARIVFGAGSSAGIPRMALEFGRHATVVTGRNAERAGPLIAYLEAAGIMVSTFALEGEPTVNAVQRGAERLRRNPPDVVIAFGGGSAIDGAKAIAALATNSGDPFDHLEVVGRGQPIEHPPIPLIAVPTTAGTGSEVTRNAVLDSTEHGVKASLRSPMMLPRIAVVDPELTLALPPAITASTGLDALTQLIEPYVSIRANPMTDLFCLDGIQRAARSLESVYRNGADAAGRADMSFASLLGGLALANAGLGVVHGFAAPVGGMFQAPHGAVCAAVLGAGMDANIRALRERSPQSATVQRYREIARILTGDPEAIPEDGPTWVRQLCGRLSIPGLRAYGIDRGHFPQLAEKAASASSMKANPIVLTANELTAILDAAL